MNPILFSLGLSMVPSIWVGAAMIDDSTNVPIKWVFGCVITMCMVGMWVSTKVTKFEGLNLRFAEQQAENIKRLDALDDRLLALDDKMAALSERLYRPDRKH